MPITSEQLEAAIRNKFADKGELQKVLVFDVSGGCGQAYEVVIVSPVFEGMPTLKRHRMINEMLKDEIAELHAFTQRSLTPAQAEGKTWTAPS